MVRCLGYSRSAALSILSFALILSPKATPARDVSPAASAQAQVANGTSTSTSHSVIAPEDLEVSWRKMPARFLHDEKDMWLFPVKLAEGKHWLPTAIIVGGTAAFIKEDPPLERKVRQTDIFSEYNKVLKSSVSGGLIAVVPAGLFAGSLLRHPPLRQRPNLLAGQGGPHDGGA